MEKSSAIIIISITVQTDLERCWHHFNDPQHIIHWNHASDDWHCPFAENDLNPGGHLHFRMEAKDGSFGFDLKGQYETVQPFTKVCYVMDDHRRVEVQFEELNGIVKVTESFQPEQEASLELQEAGWQAILNNFKSYCETDI